MIDRFVDALNNAGLLEVTLASLIALGLVLNLDIAIEEKRQIKERKNNHEDT